MPQANEIALAKSAAPANISGRATIKVLTRSGYEVAQKGDNGSVCTVMRGFSAPTYTPAPFRNLVYDPTVRAPICFTPQAVREVLPYYELRTKLAMQGKNPDPDRRRCASRLCERRTSPKNWCELRLHVVGRSKSRFGGRPLAPACNGVRAVLRQFGARRKHVRIAASSGYRRRGNSVHGCCYPGRRQSCGQGRAEVNPLLRPPPG